VTRLEAEEIMEVRASESLEPFPEALLQPFGLKRALCLSLWRGHELIGIQVCGYQEGEACTPRDLRVARGISQLASLALANAELLDRLEQADRLKSDFLSSMSHELRTPLHIILGYTGLLAEETFGPLTAAQRNSLERIEKSARELLDLVNAALDLSRLQSQGLPLHVQAVDPATLVTELMADTCSLNRNPDLKLEYRVDPELPRLHTDLVKLKMVLKHLLTNVLKFTERGTISLTVETREDGIEFTVSDTGIAIPADELSLIFEPFRHGMAATRGRIGAVGLGLYIVRLLLDVLQGRVSVTSEAEKGTTFRVWIPLLSHGSI
jgi:signal transduction histidine kinase